MLNVSPGQMLLSEEPMANPGNGRMLMRTVSDEEQPRLSVATIVNVVLVVRYTFGLALAALYKPTDGVQLYDVPPLPCRGR